MKSLSESIKEFEKTKISEAMETKLVRVSNSVVIKYEAHITQALRGQTLVKIMVFLEINGMRPFENKDYKAVNSAIFTKETEPKPLELANSVFVTDTPVHDANKWAKEQIKNYKKL